MGTLLKQAEVDAVKPRMAMRSSAWAWLSRGKVKSAQANFAVMGLGNFSETRSARCTAIPLP